MADIQDLISNNLIGPTAVAATCTQWENILLPNISSTFDAHMKAVNELFLATEPSCMEPGDDCYQEVYDHYQQLINVYYRAVWVSRAIFANSVGCTPQTGPSTIGFNEVQYFLIDQPETYGTWTRTAIARPGIVINIDYGDGTFKEEYWNDYERAVKEYFCEEKKLLQLWFGEDFPVRGNIQDPFVEVN